MPQTFPVFCWILKFQRLNCRIFWFWTTLVNYSGKSPNHRVCSVFLVNPEMKKLAGPYIVGNEGPSTFTGWYIGDSTSLIPYESGQLEKWIFQMGVEPKIVGFPPKWMVKISWKTLLFFNGWFGGKGKHPYFWKHPYGSIWIQENNDLSDMETRAI